MNPRPYSILLAHDQQEDDPINDSDIDSEIKTEIGPIIDSKKSTKNLITKLFPKINLIGEDPKAEIKNIVISGVFPLIYSKIDLNRLWENIYNFLEHWEYNHDRFPAIQCRFADFPNMVLTLFNTRKFNLTGIRNLKNVPPFLKRMEIIFQLMELINESDTLTMKSCQCHITNSTAVHAIDGSIDLNLTSINLENTSYEPEVFPGLIYRPTKFEPERPVLLIYSNGRLICVGLRDIKKITQIFSECEKNLRDNSLLRYSGEKVKEDDEFDDDSMSFI
jgi:TATA-box binding protein (TBP) (component of TFIID and TFIIIB)